MAEGSSAGSAAALAGGRATGNVARSIPEVDGLGALDVKRRDRALADGEPTLLGALQRDGRPTPLGVALAHYSRVRKSLHVLRLAPDRGCRRQIKAQANLEEGRHDLARRLFHGDRGELRQRYRDGMEDQLGALGLVLNIIVLFNTRCMNAALEKLRADGFPVDERDVARLSPLMRKHISIQGTTRSRPRTSEDAFGRFRAQIENSTTIYHGHGAA